MKKALFVDHMYHKKTRSADFFVDVLRNSFDIELYYLEPDNRPDAGVLSAAAGADIVILWQMDFLAPVFSAMGKPVVVAPMFDGSGNMPDLHWMFAHKARFFNFSIALNERIRMAGCQTMLLRYFPEPVEESHLPRFDKLNAFFWQRRPDHGLDFNLVDTMLGDEIDNLHLHNAPDVPGDFHVTLPKGRQYKLTQSTWFKDKAGYANCLAKANVFIAPRVAEGIGMALLEAMAAGKLVLAHDAPTNNEYILNWFNGILFDKSVASPTRVRDQAARIARAAWRTSVEGRKQWLASHPAVIDWVMQAETPPPIDMDHRSFFESLWSSYYASPGEYVSCLTRHLALLAQLTDLPLNKLLDAIGEAHATNSTSPSVSRASTIGSDGLIDLTDDGDRHVGEGWSSAEPDWRWAIGNRSELHFSGLHARDQHVKATFRAASLPQLGRSVQCTIALNGKIVHEAKIKPDWEDHEFEFSADFLKRDNSLILAFDKSTTLPSDSRRLSVCFKFFRFS